MNGENGGSEATGEQLRDAIEEAERRQGAELDLEWPGCDDAIGGLRSGDLPFRYECHNCEATYEVRGEDDVERVEKW